MFPSIVADIGGTNARFALVTGEANGQFAIENIQILNGKDYSGFEQAMQAYIDGLDGIQPHSACVAIAGPINADSVKMTNLSWSFSCAAVRDEFGFEKFAAINDFGALAVATSALLPSDLISVRVGKRDQAANKAILGPGTGLGVAGLVCNKGQWIPVPSEGGHVNIPPATALECEIIKAAMATHGYVSAETFISGPGLINLYNALCAVKGVSARVLEPKDITGDAMEGKDDTCVEALNAFCSFIGSVAGNLALTYGAKGGVYLGGGILPRIVDFIKNSEFDARFAEKGVMHHYVENIPVDIIAHPQTAFLGAAAYLKQQ